MLKRINETQFKEILVTTNTDFYGNEFVINKEGETFELAKIDNEKASIIQRENTLQERYAKLDLIKNEINNLLTE